MKHIVSVSLLSLVSSLAMAEQTPAAAPAPAAEPAAAAKSEDTTKVSMRVQLDSFYKDLNNANNNYKTPKLDTLRVMFARTLGSNGKVDAELRLNELEKANGSKDSDDNVVSAMNSNVLKYYHILFNVPGVDGLEVGYVREYDPALYGLTEKNKSSNIVNSLSLTGHMNRIEGYRATYQLHDAMHTSLTYHLARDQELDDSNFTRKPNKATKGSTWYHKLTADTKVGETKVQLGYGMQGKFLPDGDKTSRKNFSFIHLQAKHDVDEQLHLKGGVAYDTYATEKVAGGTGNNVATTILVAAKYDLMPKEFAVIGEFDVQMLKTADKILTDFSGDENKLTDKATTMVFTLAGQYMLDSKLSILPSYQYRNSDIANNAKPASFKSEELLGSDGKSSKTHQALGLRIRYDY